MQGVSSSDGVRAPAAYRCAGVTYRMGDHYARTGVVKPSIARGRYRQRVYGFSDVLALLLVRELRAAGLGLGQIRRAVAILRSHGSPDAWPPTVRLLTNGRAARMVIGPEEEIVDAVLALPGQQGWYTVVDVAGLVREAREAFGWALRGGGRRGGARRRRR